jgi:DNA-directed RNA polymerase specialized sigma24 family protein
MDDSVERLPRVYAEFLLLRREGLADTVIAERLGVPVEAVPLLARLAEAKLAHLRRGRGDESV